MTINFDFCKICGELANLTSHRCPPKWEVTEDNQFNTEWHEWQTVRASSPENAAAKFAEKVWEYRTEFAIYVREPNSRQAREFTINVEAIPHFHASLTSESIEVPTIEAGAD